MEKTLRTEKIEVDGNEIAGRETGEGEPVLLVHGITTWSFIWNGVMPALAAGRRVIAPDLLGCGESDKPLDRSYSLKAHAERVARFAEALELGPVHYVGHDLGGGIGQILAVRHPEAVRSLSLVNSVAYDYWPVQPIIAMRTPIIRQLAMASLDLGSFRIIVKRALYHKELLTDALMAEFAKPMSTREGRKAFLHFAHCLDNRDLTEITAELRSLPMPVLIVRGEADPYLGSEISDKLHREIPGSVLVKVPTGGHYLMLDEPRIVSDAVLAHLGGLSGR